MPTPFAHGPAPRITDESRAFWSEAEQGRLVVDRCQQCGLAMFPPRRWCPRCARSDTIDQHHEISSGARLYSWTINHVEWLPGIEVPAILALSEFDGVPGVRIPCRLRTSAPDRLQAGLPLRIGFEPGPGDLQVPSFTWEPDD